MLTFVAGNPLQPLAISMVLKVLFRGSALQVSIHNDLSSWFSPGLLNVLKRSFFRLCIPNVDLFRFVSNSQKNTAEKLFRISGKRSVVCAIPLELPNFTHKVRTRVEKVLGFVGRIHEERGVLEWIAVAKNLPEFQTLVVGDGPLWELSNLNLAMQHFSESVQISKHWKPTKAFGAPFLRSVRKLWFNYQRSTSCGSPGCHS